MAITGFNGGCRPGAAAVEITNGSNYTLVVRVTGETDGGFELAFESMADAEAVKTVAKSMAPDLADAIDAAFA